MQGEGQLGIAEVDLGNPRIPLPKSIGRFSIHGRLGRGGMGVVLDASTPDGERVALKLIRPIGDRERMQINARRLVREARILQRIDSPGVVHLVDSGILEDGVVYLAMEQVLGVTLLDVRRRTAVDADTLAALGMHLAETLEDLHGAGIVHRDIKPENVIIDQGGRAVLADFGIARHEGATGITGAGEVVGSVGYLAPECFKGQTPSPKSDQYALGRLLFEMCATRPPEKIAEGTPVLAMFALKMLVDWDRFPEGAPWPTIEPILRRMIAEEPGDRYPNAQAVADAFREFSDVRKEGFVGLVDAAKRPAKAAVANPTVYAPAQTLAGFVEKLGLEPRSPWIGVEDVEHYAEVVTLPPPRDAQELLAEIPGDPAEEVDLGSLSTPAPPVPVLPPPPTPTGPIGEEPPSVDVRKVVDLRRGVPGGRAGARGAARGGGLAEREREVHLRGRGRGVGDRSKAREGAARRCEEAAEPWRRRRRRAHARHVHPDLRHAGVPRDPRRALQPHRRSGSGRTPRSLSYIEPATIRLPNGESARSASLRCWIANGMPMMVTAYPAARVMWLAKIQMPATISQTMLAIRPRAPPPALERSCSMSFPKGRRPRPAILKHWMPKGMPTTVRQRISPPHMYWSQMKKPPKTTQMTFRIRLMGGEHGGFAAGQGTVDDGFDAASVQRVPRPARRVPGIDGSAA